MAAPPFWRRTREPRVHRTFPIVGSGRARRRRVLARSHITRSFYKARCDFCGRMPPDRGLRTRSGWKRGTYHSSFSNGSPSNARVGNRQIKKNCTPLSRQQIATTHPARRYRRVNCRRNSKHFSRVIREQVRREDFDRNSFLDFDRVDDLQSCASCMFRVAKV